MDAPIGETLQALVRMIDNVNERNSLMPLVQTIAVTLASSARRRGDLNQVEVDVINAAFADIADDEAMSRYPRFRDLYESALALWEASEPK